MLRLTLACVASVSVRSMSKERGTRDKDRAKNGASKRRAGRVCYCCNLWCLARIAFWGKIYPSWIFRLPNNHLIKIWKFRSIRSSNAAGLGQSVERLTAEREVAGSIPWAGPKLRFLKSLRNEGTSFALQAARPSRGSDDHVNGSPVSIRRRKR